MVRKCKGEGLPINWNYDYLDKFVKRGSGHTPNKQKLEYWNGDIKWISLTDSSILDRGYIFNTAKKISEKGLANSSAVLHPAETVVLSRDAGVGKSAVMSEPMAVSQHFVAWRCDNKKIMSSWFLYYWLQIMKPEFERQAIGSTIKTIGLPYFKKLRIAVPPFSEQTKIVQILSTWDKAIETTEQLLNNSQQQKKALMQQLLTGKKRFPGFKGEWVITELGKITKYSKGYTYKSTDYSEVPTNNGFFTLKSIEKGGGFNEEGIKFLSNSVERKFQVIPGDIIFAITDVTRMAEVVGAPMFVPDLGLSFMAISMDMIKLVLTDDIDNKFLFYSLKLRNARCFMKARASGSTVLHLDIKNSKKLKIKMPKNKIEQQKIASMLSVSDNEIETLQQQLIQLKQDKRALMQQLLTGKRRVKVEKGFLKTPSLNFITE